MVGESDTVTGERVVAYVTPNTPAGVTAVIDVDDVLAHCRRKLSGYKIPASLHVVDRLPLTAMGKRVRAQLRYVHPGGRPGFAKRSLSSGRCRPAAPGSDPISAPGTGSSRPRWPGSSWPDTVGPRCGRSPTTSGVTQPALYYHFGSKDGILAALIEPLLAAGDELLDSIDGLRGPHDDVVRIALSGYYDVTVEHLGVFLFVESDRSVRSHPVAGHRLAAQAARLLDAVAGGDDAEYPHQGSGRGARIDPAAAAAARGGRRRPQGAHPRLCAGGARRRTGDGARATWRRGAGAGRSGGLPAHRPT